MPIDPDEMLIAACGALHTFDAIEEKPMGILAQSAIIAALLALPRGTMIYPPDGLPVSTFDLAKAVRRAYRPPPVPRREDG